MLQVVFEVQSKDCDSGAIFFAVVRSAPPWRGRPETLRGYGAELAGFASLDDIITWVGLQDTVVAAVRSAAGRLAEERPPPA